MAILSHDDPVVGRDYLGPGQHLRDFDVLDQQYPCTDTRPHECGKVLAGCWWDIKEALQVTEGEELGRDMARQLFTDWSRLAAGGSGTDSAHPGTVIETLSADDERYGDDDISNGTPHDCAICRGFWAHHLPCPAVLLDGDNCDGDGVPDRCSGDCNDNQVPDACDVFAATSTDCDSDGVPDECSGDCNANAIYDACDIQSIQETGKGISPIVFGTVVALPSRGARNRAVRLSDSAQPNTACISATDPCVSTCQETWVSAGTHS